MGGIKGVRLEKKLHFIIFKVVLKFPHQNKSERGKKESICDYFNKKQK